MSKVDWINWKTNPKEIINPNKIEEYIQDCFQNYNTYVTPVIYEQLRYETTKGGLTKDSFQISNIAPANEMALDIMKQLDEIKDVIYNLQKSVRNNTEEQKKIEKQQLIEALEEKIKNEKMLLESIDNKNPEVKQYFHNIGENLDDAAYIIRERIIMLQERLDSVKSL